MDTSFSGGSNGSGGPIAETARGRQDSGQGNVSRGGSIMRRVPTRRAEAAPVMTAYRQFDGIGPLRKNPIMETVKFTLRFEKAETHELLRLLAARWGISMNRLAEDILELELLRRYRPERELRADIAAIARAEVEVDDPAEGRMVDARAVADPHGIAAA